MLFSPQFCSSFFSYMALLFGLFHELPREDLHGVESCKQHLVDCINKFMIICDTSGVNPSIHGKLSTRFHCNTDFMNSFTIFYCRGPEVAKTRTTR